MEGLNLLLVPLTWLLGLVTFGTGVFLLVRAYYRFRYQINQSINLDLEVIQVINKRDGEDAKSADAWKEEIVAMEELITALSRMKFNRGFWRELIMDRPSLVFEIANPGDSEEIFFYFAVPKLFRESVEKAVHSFFPSASVEKVHDYTIFSPGSAVAVSTLGLSAHKALPLKTYRTLDVDPLNSISNALSKLDTKSEGAVIQLLLTPAEGHWRKEGQKIAQYMQQGHRLEAAKSKVTLSGKALRFTNEVARGMTGPGAEPDIQFDKAVNLTPEEQDLIKSIDTKVRKGAFAVNIRLLASAETESRAEEILSHLENSFRQFENHDVNHFTVKKRKKNKRVVYDYIFRNFDEEQAIVLNTEEIASVFHFPISTTETPKIKWLKAGAAPPPINIPKEGTLLAYNNYRGQETEIRITDSDRRRHMYVVGQTGVGKSNFLQEMAKRDALSGKGFCFIDPHGDAIEDILGAIPKERAEDVVLIDPSDVERPIGINMLEYDPVRPEQKTFVINEMIGIFDQLYDLSATGGPMFEQYMRNAMLLVMDHPESGSTIMEISKVLADEEFRKMKLNHCQNPIVRDFWIKEAEKAGGDAALANMVPYITSKLTPFVANDFMRPIIAQQKSSIDFRALMDEGKIVLVNLSKGKIGEINARLLGMVIVGKILMASLSRVDVPEDQRKDFYLYLDEFQNVTTNSISQILSEARKYRLVLILAHQFIGQLKEDISKAVFGNVGSLIAFRVGSEDGEFLEKQFAPVFTAQDLVNVDNFNCFARLLMNNELTKPFSMKTYPPTSGNQELANALKELSRLRYGRDAKLVNREIMERSQLRS